MEITPQNVGQLVDLGAGLSSLPYHEAQAVALSLQAVADAELEVLQNPHHPNLGQMVGNLLFARARHENICSMIYAGALERDRRERQRQPWDPTIRRPEEH